MMKMQHLPRLSRQFWSYLYGLDQDVDQLLNLLDEERLSLLGKEFSKILQFARQKEELIKRIAYGEERLSNVIRQILKKVDWDKDLEEGGVLRAFKDILAFKDFLQFEAWYTVYMKKKEEVRKKNLRNLKWAQEGLKESIEMSKLLMGRGGAGCPGGTGRGGLFYDQNGALKDGV